MQCGCKTGRHAHFFSFHSALNNFAAFGSNGCYIVQCYIQTKVICWRSPNILNIRFPFQHQPFFTSQIRQKSHSNFHSAQCHHRVTTVTLGSLLQNQCKCIMTTIPTKCMSCFIKQKIQQQKNNKMFATHANNSSTSKPNLSRRPFCFSKLALWF